MQETNNKKPWPKKLFIHFSITIWMGYYNFLINTTSAFSRRSPLQNFIYFKFLPTFFLSGEKNCSLGLTKFWTSRKHRYFIKSQQIALGGPMLKALKISHISYIFKVKSIMLLHVKYWYFLHRVLSSFYQYRSQQCL